MGFFGGSSWQGDNPKTPRLPRCGRCGLAKKCYSPRMPPSGEGRRSLYFLGEAPGEEEDRQGTQLIGPSGILLREELAQLDVELDDCTKNNAVICRPPDNEIKPKYIDACRPTIYKSIKKTKPNVIVPLGGSAVKSVISMERSSSSGGITKWAGYTIPSHEHQAWICPTYHPAYLLRMEDQPVLKVLFRRHLKAAVALEKEPIPCTSLETLREQVECVLSTRLAKKRLRDLAKREGELAFDYETNCLKPQKPGGKIVSCSFSLEGEDTFAFLWDESLVKSVSAILRSERFSKIASNMKFEERWTREKLGHPVANWGWDTMLSAHALDNRPGITSVKFQAYLFFGVADYDKHVEAFKRTGKDGFNTLDRMDKKDLLEYNGLDSLVEFMVARKQKENYGW